MKLENLDKVKALKARLEQCTHRLGYINESAPIQFSAGEQSWRIPIPTESQAMMKLMAAGIVEQEMEDIRHGLRSLGVDI